LTKYTRYAEAINLLYSSNRFIFQWGQDAVAFSNNILPQRAAAIRAVQIHHPIWWDIWGWLKAYTFLSSLKQLRTLDITFEASPYDAGRRNDTMLNVIMKQREEELLNVICGFRDDVSVTLALGSATVWLLDQVEGRGKPNLHVVMPPESQIF
jgi:hypothetical protein